MRPYTLQVSRQMTGFTSTKLTVMLNPRSVTARLFKSICRTPGVNGLDVRLSLVTTSIGVIGIIGQGGCEREDRLRQEELVLGRRKTPLQTFTDYVE
jgi:hypothetical protein